MISESAKPEQWRRRAAAASTRPSGVLSPRPRRQPPSLFKFAGFFGTLIW
jgi:hypothetical protein